MKIALIGNQNCGKTTLFNQLTGSNQKVGNWPGVTIEQKIGTLKNSNHTIIDLPGIYSLSPYTPEEDVSRHFLFEEKPDLIINIIDATSLERSLYLTTMLLELDCDVVIALNMQDMLEKRGIKINLDNLSRELGATVISISALKNTGIEELITTINSGTYLHNNHQHIFSNDIEEGINEIITHIHMPHERFSAIKMIENDPKLGFMHARETEEIRSKIESKYDMDIEEVFANKRYEYVSNIKKKCFEQIEVKESATKKIDKVILNRWAAIPIFLGIIALIYFLAIFLGGKLTDLLLIAFNGDGESFLGLGGLLANAMASGGASAWSISLVKDGIIAGVGGILSFIPQIIILFICISILETIGYMSRIAYFFDRIFHSFGLSGKSLIPFIVGTGCSVPGIMSSRIIEDDKEKRITIALTPMMPCSAKLPIIATFAGFIVGNSNSGLSFIVALLTYVTAVVVILAYAFILNRTLYRGDSTSFLSELPEYKLPDIKYVARDVMEKTLEFIKRAGTIILISSIIIWVLLHFGWNFVYLSSEQISSSMLADIGRVFAWFFYPMTGGQYFDNTWAIAVSAIQGLIAREQVIASMQVIGNQAFIVFRAYPVTAVAFLFFILFSIPCVASVGATKKETGSWPKTLVICAFQLLSSWTIASIIGGVGVAIANIM